MLLINQIRLTAFTLLLLNLLAATAMANTPLSEDAIRVSYQQHAAKAQLYRWYQYYENSQVGIENQLDILTEDFSVTSASGTANGRDQYREAVKQFPASWKNAHQVKQSDVTVNDDGTLSLDAKIIFTNIGMAPDDALSALKLSYQATMSYNDARLPKFSKMSINGSGAAAATEFSDTYVNNRLHSLVHNWLAIVEHPRRNADGLREILTNDFDIKFSDSSKTLTSFNDMADWMAGPVSTMSATRHAVHGLSYSTIAEGQHELSVNFDWDGIKPDGTRMTAKTRHTWIVMDNPAERFARINKIRVEYIEPFSVINE